MKKSLKFIMVMVLCSLFIACESDSEAKFRLYMELENAIKLKDLKLATVTLSKLRKYNNNDDNIYFEARILIEYEKYQEAKKLIKMCHSKDCNSLRIKIVNSELKGLLENGLSVNEYEQYIDYQIKFDATSKENKIDLCSVIDIMNENGVFNKIDDRVTYVNILRGKILFAAKNIYKNVDMTTQIPVKNRTVKSKLSEFDIEKLITKHEVNAMLFRIAQKTGFEIGHKMDNVVIESKNLALFGANGMAGFRKKNETACSFVDRSLLYKNNFMSGDLEKIPDGNLVFFDFSGIKLNKNVVRYHALIARFNDVFNEYQTIKEQVYLRPSEFMTN